MTIAALWLTSDQQAALRELARVLRRGGRLVFTCWEQHIPMPFVSSPVANYRPLLERAGFRVDTYERLPHTEPVMKRIYQRIREEQTTLLAEMGEAVRGFIREAHFVPGLVDGTDYISPSNGPSVLCAATKL